MGENLQEGRKQGIKSFFQLLQGGALPLPQTHLADLLGKQGGGAGARLSSNRGLCWSEPGSLSYWMLV